MQQNNEKNTETVKTGVSPGEAAQTGPATPGKSKVYKSQPKKGISPWIWLLPLLAMAGLALWWFNRPHTQAAAPASQTDGLKPDAGSATDKTASTWTATGIADGLRRTGRVSLGDAEVHFATASSQLEGDSQAVLDQVALALKDNPDWTMRVVGHTDSTGTPAGNEHLARQRAESVAAYLSTHGVSSRRLRPLEEQGEREPRSDNASSAGRAGNRRVELIKE